MTGAVDRVLERLERVRPAKGGGWHASCPTANHRRGDQSAGLCIDVRKKDPPGAVLYCPGGCTSAEIVEALGLQIGDLYDKPLVPDKLPRWVWDEQKSRWSWETTPKHAYPFNGRLVLQALAHEVTVVMVAANDISKGATLSEADAARVALAAGRITNAWEACR